MLSHQKFEVIEVFVRKAYRHKIRLANGLTPMVTARSFSRHEAYKQLERLNNGKRHLVFVVLKSKGGAA